MMSFSRRAVDLITAHNEPIHLDMPRPVRGLVGRLQECPTVRFCAPRDAHNYLDVILDGILVYIPRQMLSMDLERLTITVSSFLWMKWIVVEGWPLL
jgi:hypothetical protein